MVHGIGGANKRRAGFGKCSMTTAEEACATLATKLRTASHIEKTWPNCLVQTAARRGIDARVAIVTTVWEHVDGVSRTMKRFGIICTIEVTWVLVMLPISPTRLRRCEFVRQRVPARGVSAVHRSAGTTRV